MYYLKMKQRVASAPGLTHIMVYDGFIFMR